MFYLPVCPALLSPPRQPGLVHSGGMRRVGGSRAEQWVSVYRRIWDQARGCSCDGFMPAMKNFKGMRWKTKGWPKRHRACFLTIGPRWGAPGSVISYLEKSHPSSHHPPVPSATARVQLGTPWPRMGTSHWSEGVWSPPSESGIGCICRSKPSHALEAVFHLLWFFQYSTINKSITPAVCFSGHETPAVLTSTTRILQTASL